MNRVQKKSTITSVVTIDRTVVGACANTTVLAMTLVDLDPTMSKSNKVPFMQIVSRNIAIFLASKKYVDFMRNYACNAKLTYATFGLFNRVQAIVFKSLSNEGSITAANPNNSTANVKSINQAPYRMTCIVLDNGLATFLEVTAAAEVLEVTEMYRNSVFSQESQTKLAVVAVEHRPPSSEYGGIDAKKQKQQQKVQTPATMRNTGTINVQGSGMVNLPDDWPEDEIALCPAKLCTKSKGCKTPGCVKNQQDPVYQSSTLVTYMKAHIIADLTLSWNSAMMTPDIQGLKFSAGKVEK